ncbi:hypothetical protein JB92DRAFT_3142448 [Gautieria morchelliformis]|nr:hypothetical protein JB92DRAFT_3142448 [Gautieria morchelliformis]
MTPATLPYELLFDCLDFAATPPLNFLGPDYKCLRSLSLVSKQIGSYAQKALFRSVILSKSRHALAFGNALNPGTERGRWLAGLVKTLRIQLRIHRGGLTQKLFTAALLACPNLFELELDISDAPFDMSPFATVFISRASHIQALRIASSSGTAPDILSVFPSLKFVEFKTAIPFRIPHGCPPACRLTELHWLGPVNDYLLWVLQNSVGILEVLSLASPRFPLIMDKDRFECLIHTHGPSLRSLHIPSLPDSQMVSIRHCSQLEELIIDGMLSEGALALLPETIEHLQFQFACCYERELSGRVSGYTHSFLSYLAHFIETAPSLLTLTWVHDITLSKRLQELCDRRGILCRRWIQPYPMYRGERQELGYVDSFPRALPMSPLRASDLASATKYAQEN